MLCCNHSASAASQHLIIEDSLISRSPNLAKSVCKFVIQPLSLGAAWLAKRLPVLPALHSTVNSSNVTADQCVLRFCQGSTQLLTSCECLAACQKYQTLQVCQTLTVNIPKGLTFWTQAALGRRSKCPNALFFCCCTGHFCRDRCFLRLQALEPLRRRLLRSLVAIARFETPKDASKEVMCLLYMMSYKL